MALAIPSEAGYMAKNQCLQVMSLSTMAHCHHSLAVVASPTAGASADDSSADTDLNDSAVADAFAETDLNDSALAYCFGDTGLNDSASAGAFKDGSSKAIGGQAPFQGAARGNLVPPQTPSTSSAGGHLVRTPTEAIKPITQSPAADHKARHTPDNHHVSVRPYSHVHGDVQGYLSLLAVNTDLPRPGQPVLAGPQSPPGRPFFGTPDPKGHAAAKADLAINVLCASLERLQQILYSPLYLDGQLFCLNGQTHRALTVPDPA